MSPECALLLTAFDHACGHSDNRPFVWDTGGCPQLDEVADVLVQRGVLLRHRLGPTFYITPPNAALAGYIP